MLRRLRRLQSKGETPDVLTQDYLQGATATVSLRQPRTEAHLSQLAVLENFAEHGLYVKFSNEEAEELEREALALALEESTQEVGADR